MSLVKMQSVIKEDTLFLLKIHFNWIFSVMPSTAQGMGCSGLVFVL